MRTNSPETLLEFQRRFPDDAACEAFLIQWRWPEGVRCPRCSGNRCTRLEGRRQWQCHSCRHQVSITAGTILHRTRLPLRKWFWAIFLVARHKKSISALQLQADLGLGSYRTAWLLLHKIRASFDESSAFPLRGVVEIDETLVGRCAPDGPRGRGSERAVVVAAVERREDGALGDARSAVVANADAETLKPLIATFVTPGSTIATDGWRGYLGLQEAGYHHQRAVSRYGRKKLHPVLDGAHLFFSNFKTWIRGRFHGVSPKYVAAYLAEFTYRFNRRNQLADGFAWLTRRLMARSPRTLAQIVG